MNFNWLTSWFQNPTTPVPQAKETLADTGTSIKDAAETILGLFDNGFNVYTSVVERMNAIKLLNAQTANKISTLTPTPSATTPAQSVSDFLKSQEGMIVAGGIGVLLLAIILTKR